EALRGNARLTHVGHAPPDRPLRGQIHVGVFEYHEWVAAPKLEDRLLDVLSRSLPDSGSGVVAARERHTLYPIIIDDPVHEASRHDEVRERPLREAGIAEERSGGLGTLLDSRRVLEEHDVASHQGRRREADDLVEGIIPRFDAEDHAEGLAQQRAVSA